MVLQAAVGAKPLQWMRGLRCRLATVLVSNGLYTKQAAVEVGFANASHFCCTFKKVYQRSPAMNSSGFEKRFNAAREALLDEDFPRALRLLEKIARQHPRGPWIWHEYGCAAAGCCQLDLAERAWHKARQLKPEDPRLLLSLGHSFRSIGRNEEALACFSQASVLDARAIDPRISMAVVQEHGHLFDEARVQVEECLAIDPRDEQACYMSALLDRRQNKLEAAERQLRDLIDTNPKHPYVRYACRYELAQLLDRRGCFDEAMLLLMEAKTLVKTLAETEEIAKHYDRWAETVLKATRLFPRDILHTWAKEFPERKRERNLPLAFLGGILGVVLRCLSKSWTRILE